MFSFSLGDAIFFTTFVVNKTTNQFLRPLVWFLVNISLPKNPEDHSGVDTISEIYQWIYLVDNINEQ